MRRVTELKVKVMSLAAEARIIRREEKKWPGYHPKRFSLYHHRVCPVRREARASQLAYGFLRGRRYEQLERPDSTPADWGRVRDIAAKFGDMDRRDAAQKLAEWHDAERTDARPEPQAETAAAA